MINSAVDIDDMSKASSSSPQRCDPLAQNKDKVIKNEHGKILFYEDAIEQDNEEESDTNNVKSNDVSSHEINDDVIDGGPQQRLLMEQLSVLRAEKDKLLTETEVLKLQKDKIKLQMTCYSNEIDKQRLHKEKLRLQIELLKAKVVDIEDNTHFIIVPPR